MVYLYILQAITFLIVIGLFVRSLQQEKTLKNVKKHVSKNSEDLGKVDPERIEAGIRSGIAEVGEGLRTDIDRRIADYDKRLKEFSLEHSKYTLRMEDLESITRKNMNRANTREARAEKSEKLQQRIDELESLLMNSQMDYLDPGQQDQPDIIPVDPQHKPRLVRRK